MAAARFVLHQEILYCSLVEAGHGARPAAAGGKTALSELHRKGVTGVGEAVVGVHVDETRLEAGQLLFLEDSISANDENIARSSLVRRGPVYRNDAGAFLGADCVGREAFAVHAVVHVHALILANIGGIQQTTVDCNRTLVAEFGIRAGHAVQLGTKQGSLHKRYMVSSG